MRRLLLLLLLGAARPAAPERPSGLYVDNGLDQTVLHRAVGPRERRELEREILSLLGLPERPPRRRAAPRVERSAPRFLLDVYRSALGARPGPPPAELALSARDLRAIEQSDVIVSLAARGHHVPGVRHERGKRLWFDASEVPADARVLGAELRLFREPGPAARGGFALAAYRVLRLEGGERELELLDALEAAAGREGWLSLNVTGALRRWAEAPASNRGLYLSVRPGGPEGRGPREARPEDVGLVGLRGGGERQPFLVAFLKSSGARERAPRRKREAKQRRRRPEASSLDYRVNPYADPQLQYNARTCKIQTLYVSFRDLEWQDWIIAPDGYDAYYCSGECNFPLNAHMNATNHAIVQTLVHLVNPGKVPKPCCAPTKLSPISVLYFQDESNVILKKYKNMVVKSCGCH